MVSASRGDGPLPGICSFPAELSEPAIAQLEAAAFSAAWLVLVAVRRPSLVIRLLATGRPMLLIEANASQAARLSHRLDPAAQARLRHCPQLPGSAGGSILWHHYNDPRCDGPRPLDDLKPRHPNLRLLHSSFRPTRPLEELLETWEEGPLAGDGQGLLLVEEASLPALLAGAGALLPRLDWLGWFRADPLPQLDAAAGIEIHAPTGPPTLLKPEPVAEDPRLLRYRLARSGLAVGGGEATAELANLRRENLALRRRIAQFQRLVGADEERLLSLERRFSVGDG